MCTTIRHRPDAIAFIGDIHGNLNVFEHTLASVVNRGVTTIIQVGDFWAGYNDPTTMDKMHRIATRIFINADMNLNDLDYRFIDGNHEDFNVLDPDATEPVAYSDWLTYMPRGCVEDINGLTIGFFGGASSIDRQHRTEGKSWWPAENITAAQAERLTEPLDILVTHETGNTRFTELMADNTHSRVKFHDLAGDANRALIDDVLLHTRPRVHIHGHHHYPMAPTGVGPTETATGAANTISLSLEDSIGSIAIIDEGIYIDYRSWTIPWGRNDCGEDIVLNMH